MATTDMDVEIVEKIGVLSVNEKSGWQKEFNRVAWNGKAPKYDIREWSPDYTKMSRGVTLSDAEAVALKELLEGCLP